jgi:fructosamine-3-kinase
MSGSLDALEERIGQSFETMVTNTAQVAGGDMNHAYRMTLEDGRQVFVKSRDDAPPAMFDLEADGLRWLRETKTARVPRVLDLADEPGQPRFLVLEWIEQVPPEAAHHEDMGHRLAALHRVHEPAFGFEHDNYIGRLPQMNGPCDSWAEFYATRRLDPLVREAVDLGRLPDDAPAAFERLYVRLDDLVGPAEPPSRLHGDLWAGNAVAGPDGQTFLVDPAVYAGHREVDLAMMRLFGGFDTRCFQAYAEVYPLAEGWADRVGLWQLYPLLVHGVLFGGGYASSVLHQVKRYAG